MDQGGAARIVRRDPRGEPDWRRGPPRDEPNWPRGPAGDERGRPGEERNWRRRPPRDDARMEQHDEAAGDGRPARGGVHQQRGGVAFVRQQHGGAARDAIPHHGGGGAERGPQPRRPLNVRMLHDLLGQDPPDLLGHIIMQQSKFLDLLNDDTRLEDPDIMLAILPVLGKALQCETSPAATLQLLNKVRTSLFLRFKVTALLANMITAG